MGAHLDEPREESIRCFLARALSPERLAHSLAVAETAAGLAERYGADPRAARIAGLLHDCARELPPFELLRQAADRGLAVDEIERREPLLLHGAVGAAMAGGRFALDGDALAAIAHHITGAPGMGLLARIVFLADFIEPGRTHARAGAARAALAAGLAPALLTAYDGVIAYVLEEGYLLHPRTVAARNELLFDRD
ncbi:MAG: bis(5'-nucleosyl)-tetraphosphatase (symmetrical) YqeK [Patescibacteria group bacterium]